MSAEAMGWAFRHSPYRGAKFDVHLAVADSVNDQHGNDLWITQGRLAQKARVSRDAANKAMKALVKDGYLELLEDNSARGRANRYRFVFKDDVAVHYESRWIPKSAEGVVIDDTPPDDPAMEGVVHDDTPVVIDDKVDAGRVQSETTGVQSETTGGVVQDYTEPKRTQDQPNGSPSARSVAASGDLVVIEFADGNMSIQIDPADHQASFDWLWDNYPRHPKTGRLGGGGNRRLAAERWGRLTKPRRVEALRKVGWYSADCQIAGRQPKHLDVWISQRVWESFDAPPSAAGDGLDDLELALAEACNLDVASLTGDARGELVMAAGAIRQVNANPPVIREVGRRMAREWGPDKIPGPAGFARHFPRFAAQVAPGSFKGSLCPRCQQPKTGHDEQVCRILQEAA